MTETLNPEATASTPLPVPGARLPDLAWLTWRQHRGSIITALLLTAGLLAWMLTTYATVGDLVDQCGNAVCSEHSPQTAQLTSDFGPVPQVGYQLSLLIWAPLAFGLFWGVPLLAREHEQRTLGLAWSQDVSRSRWLVGKFTLLGTLAAVLTAAVCVVGNQLADVVHRGTGASVFEGTYFQATGWLPVALTLAWFALGAAAGALTRRTMPAFAIVLAAFVARMQFMPRLRGNYLNPLTAIRPYPPTAPSPKVLDPGQNALLLDRGNPTFVDSSGGHHSEAEVVGNWCPLPPGRGTRNALADCVTSHRLIGTLLRYQPGGRLRTFHAIEAGSSVTLAVILMLITLLAVRATKVAG